MEIFEEKKKFPVEEKFALSGQVRRSSRPVCRAIAEGYRERQYPKIFSSKMSDADMENSESQVSLENAEAYRYITKQIYEDLCTKSEEVGRLLNHMVENPGKYAPRK